MRGSRDLGWEGIRAPAYLVIKTNINNINIAFSLNSEHSLVWEIYIHIHIYNYNTIHSCHSGGAEKQEKC